MYPGGTRSEISNRSTASVAESHAVTATVKGGHAKIAFRVNFKPGPAHTHSKHFDRDQEFPVRKPLQVVQGLFCRLWVTSAGFGQRPLAVTSQRTWPLLFKKALGQIGRGHPRLPSPAFGQQIRGTGGTRVPRNPIWTRIWPSGAGLAP
eukprot:3801288-Rhodomonas_salina.1